MRTTFYSSILFMVFTFCVGCTSVNDAPPTKSTKPATSKTPVSTTSAKKETDSELPTSPTRTISQPTTQRQITPQNTNNKYSWTKNYDINQSLVNRIKPPTGYQRTVEKAGSFPDWLRHLPLKPVGSKVNLYNGSQKPNQGVHAAVIDLDVGKRDLQQCADAVMRVKAEYHYSKKDYQHIHFNYTSGDRVAFDDWRRGKKPIVKGSNVSFSSINSSTDNSYPNFKKYMNAIFNYAGTASLSKEMTSIPTKNMQIGDVFIQGGFPGHAVLVVDMAVHPATSKKIFMIAQSYMPAQDMHILKNLQNPSLSPWYDLDFGEVLHSPEWRFTKKDLKRFAN